MKLKSIAMVVCLSVGLGLAGCGTTHGGAPVTDANGNAVSTGGMGGAGGFGGSGISSTCNTQAPANQSYFFELNSDNVRGGDNPCINAQARYLVAHPNAKVRLEGNCDNRGSREYNRGLGWRRANAVKNILLQDGVSPSQITTFSWGSEKASMGSGEAVWSKDRRVDLIFKSF